jgi:hypothetical protein
LTGWLAGLDDTFNLKKKKSKKKGEKWRVKKLKKGGWKP